MKTPAPAHTRKITDGFTLLEMLIVVGLVAGLSAVLLSGLFGGGKAAALQSAQATLASLVTATRAHAVSSGQGARLCLNVDATTPDRFLRYWVVQVKTGSTWRTTADVYLPDGVFTVPGKFVDLPAGLFSSADTWLKSDHSTALRSNALQEGQVFAEAINDTAVQKWVAIEFGASGGTAQSGDLVLALGVARPPGSYAAGESPVELRAPSAARGLTLSSYGVPALVNEVVSF